jgi:septum formation protein
LTSAPHLIPVTLGSRSPRRQQLLASILGENRVLITPPKNSEELLFDDIHEITAIEARLRQVVRMKQDDVTRQIPTSVTTSVVITADTLVIARDSAGQPVVLGQPEVFRWQEQTRIWLEQFLSGKTHSVWTCFRVSCGEQSHEEIVRSEVTFRPLSAAMIDWYISTEESVGKAGGYAIQGHGASLVSGLTGSLTNVIGLPLMEVAAALRELGIPCLNHQSHNS